MEEKLMQTMDLANGLVLRIYDASRKIADKGAYQSAPDPQAQRRVEGDIWVVCLVARMDIPVLGSFFENDGPSALNMDAVREVLGETAPFEKRLERNLVHESEKDQIFSAIVQGFMEGHVQYLSHPDFARKYIFKRYAEETSPAALHAKGLMN